MLKRWVMRLLFISMFGFSVSAYASENKTDKHSQHEAFARSFANTVVAILYDTKKSYNDRKDLLRNAFAKSVDMDWMAKFVLGRSWAHATDEQREQYTKLYRKFLTETYVSNFAENPKKRIRDIKVFGISSMEDSAEENDFTVRTEMMLADNNNMKVSYLVREDAGRYKVRDIAIENISLINTHRSEFSGIAASAGIEGVISNLEQKLENPVVVGSTN
jgi:phospholipid transport system substrate-binding protein